MHMYGEIIPSFSSGIIDRTGAQIILYRLKTCVDLAVYVVSSTTDWVSVDCGQVLFPSKKKCF